MTENDCKPFGSFHNGLLWLKPYVNYDETVLLLEQLILHIIETMMNGSQNSTICASLLAMTNQKTSTKNKMFVDYIQITKHYVLFVGYKCL